MGKTLIAACILLAACQPMYGKKAVRMRDPEPRARPANTDPVAAEIKYVEECTVDFSAPVAKKRQTAAAEQLVVTADVALDHANKPLAEPDRIHHIVRSIESYKSALIKDPYNAEATLKLALAYDRVLRKGCAIAMLKRLSKLAENPTFRANGSIDRVVDNEQWFKNYRQAALRAIGH